MKQAGKKLTAVLLCLCCLLATAAKPLAASQDRQPNKNLWQRELETIIQGIIDWKKADSGEASSGCLLNDVFLQAAGTTAGDWYPIGLGRYGAVDNYQAYLAVVTQAVQDRYKQPGKLSAVKATEWHRIALAILAMGGDPTAVGRDRDGKPINLIADGVYNRGRTASLGKQGLNGWIWGLIALDAKRYEIPAGSYYSRSDIITEILRSKLPGGGLYLKRRRARSGHDGYGPSGLSALLRKR
jgi:hypothetical protein